MYNYGNFLAARAANNLPRQQLSIPSVSTSQEVTPIPQSSLEMIADTNTAFLIVVDTPLAYVSTVSAENNQYRLRFRADANGTRFTLFSNRPQTVAYNIDKEELVEFWNPNEPGPNTFALDPPNAFLNYRTRAGLNKAALIRIIQAVLVGGDSIELTFTEEGFQLFDEAFGTNDLGENTILRDVSIFIDSTPPVDKLQAIGGSTTAGDIPSVSPNPVVVQNQ